MRTYGIIHRNSSVYYYICGAAPRMRRSELTRELMVTKEVGRDRDGIKRVKPIAKKGDGRLSKYV
jgi:predicted DNA-binding transcriptional regulator